MGHAPSADALAIIGLMNLPGVGSARIHDVLDALERKDTAPRYLLEYDVGSLVGNELLTDAQAAIFTSDEQRDWREGVIAHLEAENFGLIPVTSDEYPAQLRARGRAQGPPLLMVTGNADLLQHPGVAFAGARRATDQGIEIARNLVEKAVAQRFTIVSGGAQGTDAATHEEALKQGGRTIVVLAEGILTSRARQLAPLLESGRAAIVSSFLPHDGWQAWRAMERNRTILGLCDRLVVIEAGVRGGTLAAGQEALEADLATWILDYPDPPEVAAGNRLLLKLGAKPIPVAMNGKAEIPAELFAIEDWVVTEVRH